MEADPDLPVPHEVLKKQVGSTEKAIKGIKVEMPEFMRWLLATQWLEPTRRLNAKLDGMVDSWVKEMEGDRRQARAGELETASVRLPPTPVATRAVGV